jgi:hypothetical protein
VSVVSFSPPPSTAGDHGRSTPFGLTAATANPLRVRCKAIAPCLRKRSRSITGGGQAGGGCRAVTTSAARSQSSASASGRTASATNALSASRKIDWDDFKQINYINYLDEIHDRFPTLILGPGQHPGQHFAKFSAPVHFGQIDRFRPLLA